MRRRRVFGRFPPICFLMICYGEPRTFGQNVFRKHYDRDRDALRIWDMSTLEMILLHAPDFQRANRGSGSWPFCFFRPFDRHLFSRSLGLALA